MQANFYYRSRGKGKGHYIAEMQGAPFGQNMMWIEFSWIGHMVPRKGRRIIARHESGFRSRTSSFILQRSIFTAFSLQKGKWYTRKACSFSKIWLELARFLTRSRALSPKTNASYTASPNVLKDLIELKMTTASWLLTPRMIALNISQNDVPQNSIARCLNVWPKNWFLKK